VIVTSAMTADILYRDYGMARERIAVIRPGVDVPAPARRSQDVNDAVNLLSVGSITPRKGYDILIDELGSLKELPRRLTVAGDTTRSAHALARLQADIARLKLQDRVVVTGAVNEARLGQLYANADVFVLASLFEGYGMVFGEAVAHGLPIVATAVGAAPEIVPADAGVLVAPGDAGALRDALRHIIVDGEARNRMTRAACEASTRLPRWRESGMAFAHVLEVLT
jgi:glycosyltransferase involved in cell wall biosynthesis